jgi:hypothetical protein
MAERNGISFERPNGWAKALTLAADLFLDDWTFASVRGKRCQESTGTGGDALSSFGISAEEQPRFAFGSNRFRSTSLLTFTDGAKRLCGAQLSLITLPLPIFT